MHVHVVLSRRWVLLLGILAAAVVVVGVLAHSQSEVAAQERPATSLGASASGNPSPFSFPTTYGGRVLHWSSTVYFYSAGAKDPSNGQVLNSEVWELMGSDGLPSAYHARYTYPSGALHQDMYLTRSESLAVLGKDYGQYPPFQLSPALCVMRSAVNSTAIATYVPLFTDAATLTQAGYVGGRGAPISETLPDTPSLAGGARLTRFPSESSAQMWATPDSHVRLEVGSSGRVLVAKTTHTNTVGSIDQQAWTAVGPLDIYDSASVPGTLYTMPQTVGGCNQ